MKTRWTERFEQACSDQRRGSAPVNDVLRDDGAAHSSAALTPASRGDPQGVADPVNACRTNLWLPALPALAAVARQRMPGACAQANPLHRARPGPLVRTAAAPAHALTLLAAVAALAGCADHKAEQMHLQKAADIQRLRGNDIPMEAIAPCPAAQPAGTPSSIHLAPHQIWLAPPPGAPLPAVAERSGTEHVAILPAKQKAPQPAPPGVALLQASADKAAPQSALLTPKGSAMRLSDVRVQGWSVTLLAADDGHGTGTVHGAVLKRQAWKTAEWALAWFPQNAALADLSALEHLYTQTMAIASDSSGRFAFAERGRVDFDAVERTSLADVQSRIAFARQCAAASVARDRLAEPVPWQAVAIERSEHPPAAAADVAARLRGPQGVLAGRPLIFSRLPHMECNARSDDAGIGACQLIDTMGHTPHPGFENAPTIVSFPGELGAEKVLLPTALALRR